MNVNERFKALLPAIGIFGLIGLFFSTIESVLGIGALARMMGANLIVPICCVVILIGIYSSLIKKNSIWLVFERTGIPIGILFSTMFLLAAINGVFGSVEKEHLTYCFAILITGCFVSVIGYVAKRESISLEPHPSSFGADLGFVTLMILIIALTMDRLTGLVAFLDAPSLLMTLSPAAALFLINYKKASARRYMQTIVIGVTGALFVCVMAWTIATERDTAEGIGPAIAVSLLSMIYGVQVILISACLCSDANAEKIDFGKINWHLLEVFALIILMVFAPESVWEWAARVNPSPT